jgi:ActR/RegA family two-component response regulator
MTSQSEEQDTVLIVDDEEPVRRTFREWLESAGLDCRVIAAADAESALVHANRQAIDLAILDWNLGAGNDGLRLLEDLYVFNPDVIAIMVTGYAHQATPLDAMRIGVRDYLDKNQDLNRASFLGAVRKQLEKIRPAKQARHLHRSLVAFRAAVEKVMALVQTATALNDPVPLPRAISSLLHFLLRGTGARDGVLLVRSYDPRRQPPEICRLYDSSGSILECELVPFARSLAGSVVSLQQPMRLTRDDRSASAGVMDWQPFEAQRHSILAAPLEVAQGVHVILELFDKQGPGRANAPMEFSNEDMELVTAAADFGREMMRQALAERQAQEVLLDAVEAALLASESVSRSLPPDSGAPERPSPPAVLDQLRRSLNESPAPAVDAEDSVRLAEAIRVLAVQHGPVAVRHCIRLVQSVRELLDSATGTGEPGS